MNNFTFVAHKGARPEKSELVKSHVMRESQRRRREAKGRRGRSEQASRGASRTSSPAVNDLPSRPYSRISNRPEVPSPNINISRNETTGSNFELAARTFASGAQPPWGLSDSATVDGLPNLLSPTQGLWNIEQNRDPLMPAAIDVNLWPGQHALQTNHFETPDFLPQSTQVDSTLTLPPLDHRTSLLYPELAGDTSTCDAPWTLPQLLERNSRMSNYYASSLPIDGSESVHSSVFGYWFQAALSSQKILFCTSLYYCAIRDVLQSMKGDDHGYFMAQTLQLINSALEDPSTRLAEDTIATVISVCMYENVLGSESIITHLKGLQQMINMKGGINNLRSDQGQRMTEMVILQDMIHACGSNVGPLMFDNTGPVLRDMRTMNFEYFYPQSPLRVVNDARFTQPPPELRSSCQVLADAFDGFEILCIEAFDEDTAHDEKDTFRERRDKFLDVLQKDRRDTEEDEELSQVELKAREAVSTAARIHFRACAYRIQHDDEVNAEDMRKLCDLLRSIDLRFWKVAYYVYMWILLTAVAASHGHPQQRPYFMSELMRLGLSIGLFDWRSFRLIFGNFLWLQQFLRRDEQQRTENASRQAM